MTEQPWRNAETDPPPTGEPILAVINYYNRGVPESERIICFIAEDDSLKTESGDDIGWDSEVISVWQAAPAYPL